MLKTGKRIWSVGCRTGPSLSAGTLESLVTTATILTRMESAWYLLFYVIGFQRTV